MHSPGINGEGELRGNRLTQVHLEKWPLKRSVCVGGGRVAPDIISGPGGIWPFFSNLARPDMTAGFEAGFIKF